MAQPDTTIMRPQVPPKIPFNSGSPKITKEGIKNVVYAFFKDSKIITTKYTSDTAFKELWKKLEGYMDSLPPFDVNDRPEMTEKRNLPGEADDLEDKPALPVKRNKEKNEKVIQEARENERRELMMERDEFKKERDELKKEKDANDQLIERLKNELGAYKHELINERAKYDQHMNAWSERYDNLEDQLKSKRKDYNDLYKKNEELRAEASQYQSALGDARNYRLGDNDANNPTQLTKEIEYIQDKINEFCKLKGNIDINEPNITQLLEDYQCKYESGDKVLAKAALQRKIIETIIKRTDDYLKTPSKEVKDVNGKTTDKYLELNVLSSTERYLSVINNLIRSRKGADQVSTAVPKKIHQLVYAVLGDRGFGVNDKEEHEFVLEIKKEIITMMDSYRTIKRADKKQENEDMIADIIRNIIKMFTFRIKVLEPPGEYDWIPKDTKVDTALMELGSLEDDNYDDWVVNLCSFPLIYVKSETERKTLAPAKIMAIKVERRGFFGMGMMSSEQNPRNSTNPRLSDK